MILQVRKRPSGQAEGRGGDSGAQQRGGQDGAHGPPERGGQGAAPGLHEHGGQGAPPGPQQRGSQDGADGPGEHGGQGAQAGPDRAAAGPDRAAAGPDRAAAGRRRPAAAGGRDWAQISVYSGLAVALFLLAWLAGPLLGSVPWPVVAAGVGALVLWDQADPGLRHRLASSPLGRSRPARYWLAQDRRAWARFLLGGILVVGGIAGFLASRGQLSQARHGLAAMAAIIIGLSVVAAPWLLSLLRELDAERRKRIRADERAELAAHVHDSVLHTLTLIQRSSDDPRQVRRLARSQERQLRAWLQHGQGDGEDATLASELARVAGEVEDADGVPIEVVCVGDVALGERTSATILAAREAMVNAARHSGAPQISVYAEAEPDRVTIFVRDRGRGFDPESVPVGRLGISQSIVGRMERCGGQATVRAVPGVGTEVELRVARR
jgi:signal transduction histidine kinase